MDDSVATLEALYRETAPALLAYFRRQPALAQSADDLLQDTFVRAIEHLDRLRAAVTPRAYLFGIARHLVVDSLRSRRTTVEFTDDAAASAATEDPRLEVMRTAIAKLPEPHREALQLKLQHELSYEEIAEVLGIPVGTVRSRLHHAVAQLRNSLNPPTDQ